MRGRRGRMLMTVLLVLAVFTGGCALRDVRPMDVYGLEPQWRNGENVAAAKQGSFVLQVAPVRGAASLQTTDLLYTDGEYARQAYAYSRWREAPVSAMQTVLETALGNSGRFRAVLPWDSGAGADWVLESTLLECGHILKESGVSEGVVRMRFYLVDPKSRTVAAERELVAAIPAATRDALGAVAAINQAAQKVAGELVVWLASLEKRQE